MYDGKSWTTYTSNDGLINNQIVTIVIDKQGNKWFACQSAFDGVDNTGGGVSKFDGVHWTSFY
jgi:hypothetical protein